MYEIYDFNNVLSREQKSLLLHCVNTYLEKLEFVLKNADFYCTSPLAISLLKEDKEKLIILQQKLFNLKEIEPEGG